MVDSLIGAQACNAAEDRALYDPSPEIDSALEHALFLLKTANDVQRPHAVALAQLLSRVRDLNREEREHEMTAAGLADPVSSVHEFARLARPLLADLGNPMLGDRKRADRLGELHALFGRTVHRTRSAFSLRPLLGVKKYTRLLDELEAWDEARAVRCAS